MGRSELSEVEKGKVWETIEQTVGTMHPESRRRKDWRLSEDGRLSIFVTFSRDDQRFFDVNERDLKEWLSYPRAFIILVLGDHQQVLIVPAREMKRLVERRQPTSTGDFKLHVVDRSGGLEFTEVRGCDLMNFYNNYSQLKESGPTADLC